MDVNDELRIYRGKDYVVSDHIVIHQPSLGEITDYGEQDFWSMVYGLTAAPSSMKWQLWDMQIDYTQISSFDLFYKVLYNLFPVDRTRILFGDLDFTRFQPMQDQNSGKVSLCQMIGEDLVEIDEDTYNVVIGYLRKSLNITIDERVPGNESTKAVLIDDDREAYLNYQNREHHSQLLNLVSAMVNCADFKYNHAQVWDMKINAFMDSVSRIVKIKNSDLLLQSGYSGFGVDLKTIDKKQLDWLGEL